MHNVENLINNARADGHLQGWNAGYHYGLVEGRLQAFAISILMVGLFALAWAFFK